MFDLHTVHLERLGTRCGAYRLEKVLRHDRVRTTYLGIGPEEELFEIQIFDENYYLSNAAHEAIDNYIKALRQHALPNTSEIVESGYAADQEPYLVATKLTMDDLSSILEHRKVVGLDETLRLGINVSQTLSAMHSKGFFHGCLSPRNLYPDAGKVIVSEVGIGNIAALANKPDLEGVGVPLYMSPEQLEGKPASAASDAYALALILYECITGLPPHSSATVTELALQRRRRPPSLSSATDVVQPPEVEVFFRRALSNKASERFSDAADLNEALLSVQRRKPVAPKFIHSKIPHRYQILNHPSATNLAELQRLDVAASQSAVKSNQRRNNIVKLLFGFCAILAAGLYALTLACLAGMHQELGAITNKLPDSAATKYSANEDFVNNPPKIQKGEMSGETKLDSVMKFCTGYGLRADKCVGDFSKIADLRRLEFLSATDTAISDEELQSLGSLPLKSLEIGNCRNFTGKGFRAIQAIPTLRYLRAENLPLTSSDLEELNPALTQLALKSCRLNDEGVEKISRVKGIGKLELARNEITRNSFKYFRTMPNLYFLDLQDNSKLTRDDQIELCKIMPHTVIRFDFATPPNQSLFENVKLDKLLKQCNGLDLNAQGSNGDFSKITKCSELKDLDLSRSTAKDQDLAGFAKLPLRYVGLGSCRVGAGVLKELQKLPNLQVLDAPGSGIRDDDLVYLNPKLKELDLSTCNISDRGAVHLARLKDLVNLNLHNSAITPLTFKTLRNLKNLRQLDVRDCANIRLKEAKIFEDSLPDTIVMLDRIKH